MSHPRACLSVGDETCTFLDPFGTKEDAPVFGPGQRALRRPEIRSMISSRERLGEQRGQLRAPEAMLRHHFVNESDNGLVFRGGTFVPRAAGTGNREGSSHGTGNFRSCCGHENAEAVMIVSALVPP